MKVSQIAPKAQANSAKNNCTVLKNKHFGNKEQYSTNAQSNSPLNKTLKADTLTFTSDISKEEEEEAKFILQAMEIASDSAGVKSDRIPIFFNINVEEELSYYSLIKKSSKDFLNRFFASIPFKKAARKVQASRNEEYYKIATLAYPKQGKAVDSLTGYVLNDRLQFPKFIKAVSYPDESKIYIYQSSDSKQKAYFKIDPNNRVQEIVTGIAGRYDEKKDCQFVFDSTGTLSYFEETQDDGSIRSLTFKNDFVTAKEIGIDRKTKSIKHFLYDAENNVFLELKKK